MKHPVTIDRDFFVFLCQLDTLTRDLLVFQHAVFSFPDLVQKTPAGLVASGLSQQCLADLRHAMAENGLVLLNDELQAVRALVVRMRGSSDLGHVQCICNRAVKLIDSLQATPD